MDDDERSMVVPSDGREGPAQDRGDYHFVLAIFRSKGEFHYEGGIYNRGLICKVTEAGLPDEKLFGIGGFRDDLDKLVELLANQGYTLRDSDWIRFTTDTSIRSAEIDFGSGPVKMRYVAAPLCGEESLDFLRRFEDLMPRYKNA